MSALSADVNDSLPHTPQTPNIQGHSKEYLLYADDTVIFSNDTRRLNQILASIEHIGKLYGLQLNKLKCMALQFHNQGNLHFTDGTPVPSTTSAKYLGTVQTTSCTISADLSQRIQNCYQTLSKLHPFLYNAGCSIAFKLQVFNAVLASKALYGLESAPLLQSQRDKLDTFQLKGLRQILRLQTTYVERHNTNQFVYDTAAKTLQHERLTNWQQQRRFLTQNPNIIPNTA